MASLNDSVKYRKDAIDVMNKVTSKVTMEVTGKPSQRPKAMGDVKALTLAIRLCKLEMRRMSFDRNAYQRYGGRYPEAVKAAVRSEELERVIETLSKLKGES